MRRSSVFARGTSLALAPSVGDRTPTDTVTMPLNLDHYIRVPAPLSKCALARVELIANNLGERHTAVITMRDALHRFPPCGALSRASGAIHQGRPSGASQCRLRTPATSASATPAGLIPPDRSPISSTSINSSARLSLDVNTSPRISIRPHSPKLVRYQRRSLCSTTSSALCSPRSWAV